MNTPIKVRITPTAIQVMTDLHRARTDPSGPDQTAPPSAVNCIREVWCSRQWLAGHSSPHYRLGVVWSLAAIVPLIWTAPGPDPMVNEKVQLPVAPVDAIFFDSLHPISEPGMGGKPIAAGAEVGADSFFGSATSDAGLTAA